MKYIQPNATLVALMSEDVITASFTKTEIAMGSYSDETQRDVITFDDLIK